MRLISHRRSATSAPLTPHAHPAPIGIALAIVEPTTVTPATPPVFEVPTSSTASVMHLQMSARWTHWRPPRADSRDIHSGGKGITDM